MFVRNWDFGSYKCRVLSFFLITSNNSESLLCKGWCLIADKEALDAKAKNSVPLVLKNMTDMINTSIQTELETFDRSGKMLDIGSAEGKTMSQGKHWFIQVLPIHDNKYLVNVCFLSHLLRALLSLYANNRYRNG